MAFWKRRHGKNPKAFQMTPQQRQEFDEKIEQLRGCATAAAAFRGVEGIKNHEAVMASIKAAASQMQAIAKATVYTTGAAAAGEVIKILEGSAVETASAE